jgi:hypothetical protein
MYRKRVITNIGYVIFNGLMTVTVQAQTPTPNPDTLLQDCTRNLNANRPISSGPDAPSIKIIAPESQTVIVSEGATLADVTFKVEVHNWKLPGFYTDDPAPHWHLWLNDSVWGMFYQTEALSGIPYGTWRICVSLGDENHMDVGMPDAILLTVEKRGSQTAVITIQPSAVPSIPASSTPEQPSSLLIIILGVIAVTVGLMVGWRTTRFR